VERRDLFRWSRRISIALLLVFFVSAVSIGVSTKRNVDDLARNLKSGASSQVTSQSALAVGKSVDRILSTANLPLVKQALSLFNLDFASIKSEINSVILASPALIGADSPNRYLIAFQNSAEARGTGGILGAYAVVEFYKGSLKVVQTGSNEPLYGISLKKIPTDVPDEFRKLYGENPAILQNSNLSPHFPYGAEIWLELWKEEFGKPLDGVIAVDPTALSYVLRSTGPITLGNGEKITSENVVSDTLKDAYKRFESDNKGRKQYLVDLMNAAVAKLNSGDYS